MRDFVDLQQPVLIDREEDVAHGVARGRCATERREVCPGGEAERGAARDAREGEQRRPLLEPDKRELAPRVEHEERVGVLLLRVERLVVNQHGVDHALPRVPRRRRVVRGLLKLERHPRVVLALRTAARPHRRGELPLVVRGQRRGSVGGALRLSRVRVLGHVPKRRTWQGELVDVEVVRARRRLAGAVPRGGRVDVALDGDDRAGARRRVPPGDREGGDVVHLEPRQGDHGARELGRVRRHEDRLREPRVEQVPHRDDPVLVPRTEHLRIGAPRDAVDASEGRDLEVAAPVRPDVAADEQVVHRRTPARRPGVLGRGREPRRQGRVAALGAVRRVRRGAERRKLGSSSGSPVAPPHADAARERRPRARGERDQVVCRRAGTRRDVRHRVVGEPRVRRQCADQHLRVDDERARHLLRQAHDVCRPARQPHQHVVRRLLVVVRRNPCPKVEHRPALPLAQVEEPQRALVHQHKVPVRPVEEDPLRLLGVGRGEQQRLAVLGHSPQAPCGTPRAGVAHNTHLALRRAEREQLVDGVVLKKPRRERRSVRACLGVRRVVSVWSASTVGEWRRV